MFAFWWLSAGIALLSVLVPIVAHADVNSARSKGAAWLIQNQRGDGSWSSANGNLNVQATSAAVLALKNAGLSRSVFFGAGSAWLANADADSVDAISRKIEGLVAAGMPATAQSEANRLYGMRALSGSAVWSGYGGSGLDFVDTALGLMAMRVGDAGFDAKANAASNNAVAAAVCTLTEAVSGGSHYAWPTSVTSMSQNTGLGRPSVVATALLANELRALQLRSDTMTAMTCQSGYGLWILSFPFNWLASQQNADSGFGEQRTDGSKGASSVLVTALVYRALDSQSYPPQPQTANALNWLLVQQNANGSWRNDPLLTASVLAILPVATGTQALDTDLDGVPDVVAQQLGSNLNTAGTRSQLSLASLSVPGTTAPGVPVAATVGQLFSYSTPISGTSYNITGGYLPPGLCMNPTSGTIAGTPQLAGNYSFEYRVSDTDTYVARIDVGNGPANRLVWNLATSWNLLGNGSTTSLSVAELFGNATQVTSVWKWLNAANAWAFYSPSMTSADLATYTASNGYSVLSTIESGDGFWVIANTPFTVQKDVTSLLSSVAFQDGNAKAIPLGWNMIATGDTQTPSEFNKAIGSAVPPSGVFPVNLISLWTWDAAQQKWFFYAPTLEWNGGLAAYDAAYGYLIHGSCSSTYLTPSAGIWLNK